MLKLTNFLPSPEKKTLLLITGARQTGKTTLVKSLLNPISGKFPPGGYLLLNSLNDPKYLVIPILQG